MHVHGSPGGSAAAHDPSHGVAEHADRGGAFAVAVAINGGFVLCEVAAGLLAHSIALLADAAHNAGDVLGLSASLVAARLARTGPTGRFTYGFRAAGILAALCNAIVLLLLTGAIAAEAIGRLVHPGPADGLTVCAVALAGVVVNGGSALLFRRGREADLNRRAAFAHMAGDAVVSCAVAAAGLVVACTGWSAIDPLASLVVSVAIVAGTWSLLRDSVALALGAAPSGVDREAVARALAAAPGVSSVHDLHIWAISPTETALTAHLVCPAQSWDDARLAALADALRRDHAIGHATFQVEQSEADCPCRLGGGAGLV